MGKEGGVVLLILLSLFAIQLPLSFLPVCLHVRVCLPPSFPFPSDPKSAPIFPLYEKWTLDPSCL